MTNPWRSIKTEAPCGCIIDQRVHHELPTQNFLLRICPYHQVLLLHIIVDSDDALGL
jgi:hypothetical protein